MIYVIVNKDGELLETFTGPTAVAQCADHWLPGTYWGHGIDLEMALQHARHYTKAPVKEGSTITRAGKPGCSLYLRH